MSELTYLSASELAKGIREKTFSAVEVLKAYLNQIVKYNFKLNAIVTLDEKQALQQAKEADEAIARGEIWGVLHGVPVTIKDTFETAGMLTTAGYKPLAKYIPKQDATAVARLRAAGAIILGKTNPAELAADYQSSNSLFKRVNNPWNLNCTAGGSSGGSAAAVAAGFTPLALGSDLGGSIRQPAHCCGIFGIKPSEYRVSTAGHVPELPGKPRCVRHMLSAGPFARSIEDLKLCLSIIAGSDRRQPDIPPIPLDVPSDKPLATKRIAWTDKLGNIPVTKDTKELIQKLVTHLESFGTQIERSIPDEFNFDAAWETYGEVLVYELYVAESIFSSQSMRRSLNFLFYSRQVDAEFQNNPMERGFYRLLNATFERYFQALTRRERFMAQMDEFFDSWDIFLCPVATVPAFTHRPTGHPIEVDGKKLPYIMGCGAYTTIFNLTGNPVVTIPIGRSQTGLPIGVQIVGKRWRDMELLAIAQQIAELTEGFQRPPGY
ncbi:MAG: amidase [Hydrococcus sp. Prado102]|jgi:amidase|nr:amidase [Hydrococcus sp. Prado102]